MKNEDLFDGITEIEEKHIMEAQGRKHGRWGFRIGALAALIALAVLVQTVLRPFGDSVVTCAMAAEAVYPQVAPIADETETDFEKYLAQDEAWYESRQQLIGDGFDSQSIAPFLETTATALLSGEDNALYSPANLYLALSMLAEVTGSNTRQEILSLLGTDSIEEQRTRANALWRSSYVADGSADTILANSLWMNDEIAYAQDTLNTLAADYYASSYYGTMGSDEYDEMLQNWLTEQTHGLLQIPEQKMNALTVLALVSTLYYRADWLSEFLEMNTVKDTFHGRRGDTECDFMCKTEEGTYWYGDQFAAYGRSLSGYGKLYLLLPDEGKTPEDLLTDAQALSFLTSQEGVPSTYTDVNLKMPKLDLSAQLDLQDTLKDLGITRAFDSQRSDFTPLTTDAGAIKVSKLEQGVRLVVDEEGCLGAAYTLILGEGEEAEPEEYETVDFIVDRPFLLILTVGDGIPLFVGAVNNL